MSNPHFLQIVVELAGKVLFSAIRPQALDLASRFGFHEPFEVPETVEDFTFLLNEVDPDVLRIVVDEGDEISTPAKTNVLCRPPYIRMYQVELVPAPVSLVGERKSVLLPELAGFTNLCLPATKFGQSEHHLFRLQVLKPLVVDVAYSLVP